MITIEYVMYSTNSACTGNSKVLHCIMANEENQFWRILMMFLCYKRNKFYMNFNNAQKLTFCMRRKTGSHKRCMLHNDQQEKSILSVF